MSHLWPVSPALLEWVPHLSRLTVSRWVPLSTWPPIAQAAQSRPSHRGYQACAHHDSPPPRAGPPHARACSPSMPAHSARLHMRTRVFTLAREQHMFGAVTRTSHDLWHRGYTQHTCWRTAGHTSLLHAAAHPAHVSLPRVCACPQLVYTVHTSAAYTGVRVQLCKH